MSVHVVLLLNGINRAEQNKNKKRTKNGVGSLLCSLACAFFFKKKKELSFR